MAREVRWGTPARSPHYPRLRPLWSYVAPALLLGFLCALGYGALQAVKVRGPLSPGSVTSAHANYDTRCDACHVPRQGASNLRCQRCHDTGGGGRLNQAAHVFFGSGDARRAATTEGLACARCHVEHRGSSVPLSSVDEAQCLRCHAALRPSAAGLSFRIRSFASHPEFKVLRANLQGNPGLLFGHKAHMKPMIKEGVAGEWDTCTKCHTPERESQARDLSPISFDLHCARCHNEDLMMEPVPAADVQEDVGLRGALGAFSKVGDTIQRMGVRHRDEWVIYNMRKLQSELYPEEYARDRSALQARVSQLERRIFQAEPLVGLGLDALQQRRAALRDEVSRLTARAGTQQAGGDLVSGLDRIAEVAAAAAAAEDADARTRTDEAQRQAEELKAAGAPAAALPQDEFETRRRELLTVLDALAAADPSRQRSVDDLRRRLLALSPGEPGRENIERALRQRRDDLARIDDEIRLRQSGLAQEVRALPERVALQRELDDTQDQLVRYFSVGAPGAALSEADRQRKLQALVNLTGEGSGERCAKCHLLSRGSMAPVRAARSVMVRAVFTHKKHLIAPLPEPGMLRRLTTVFVAKKAATPADEIQRRYRCAYCHSGVEKAGDAPRKPAIPPITSCRECHRSGATRQDCQICHRYHPPGIPS
jgi:hypothetical protein